MGMAIEQAVSVTGHSAHQRQTNFGSLVSAIRRGDLAGAGNAFEALREFAPEAPGWTRKGPLTAIGEAIAGQDLAAAQAALRDYQQGKADRLDQAAEKAKPAQAGLVSGGSITILL